MAIAIDRLVNDDRFSGGNVAVFLLYAPLGVVLILVRLALCLVLWVASLLVPEKSSATFLSTVACITFGMQVKLRGSAPDTRCHLVVSNYVSVLDPLAVFYMLGPISLRKWKLPPFFASSLGIKNIAHFRAKPPHESRRQILLQPEGAATSGAALLRFTDWALPLGNTVQPVAIRVSRAFTRVTVHSGSDSPSAVPWSDLLWYLWSPATTYCLYALPPLTRHPGESVPQFAERIRRNIAAALEVETTEYDASDLLACARRGVRRPAAGAAQRPDLQRLARQVKQVLPRVPLADILRDLARTKSVDITITNFLEEITPYTPEPIAEPQPSTSNVQPPTNLTSTFPTDPKTRQMTFQERKAQMISEARKKYIAKHGLNIDMN